VVNQKTDEDWENIDLTISTAQVQTGGKTPVLSPWYISKYVPVPPAKADYKKRSKEKRLMKSAVPMAEETAFDSFEGSGLSSNIGSAKPKVMAKPKVQLEENATSTTYTISGKSTVLSNSDTHKTTIGYVEFDTEFEYTIVPKLSAFAYLQGEITNKSDYVFLPGKANVFFDNSLLLKQTLIVFILMKNSAYHLVLMKELKQNIK
jgi:uncharacterized protein (TIGR02231 family)